MPRTLSKSKNIAEDRPTERAIRVERTNWIETVSRILAARETRMVIGILLLTFAAVAALAYVSFLFTGTSDQSVLALDRPERLANREAVRNLLGLPGARLAQFMIDGSFGFVSIL
ncbi:MAG: DNA translocase FtsK 4TM domain-containing protein, partial [Paludibacteraceae bacterium]|nr:DNA translocase FtsK 4TM domain-containing protein [Paludibacteraceae bacterium]